MSGLRLIAFGLAFAAAYYLTTRPATVAVAATDGALHYPGYTINQLERWAPEARILSVKHYRSDREAELAPIDLALGWDQMAKLDVVADFDISQRNRWFYWRTERLPFPRAVVNRSMSNVHIIPATAAIAAELETLEAGQLVQLHGALVEVRAEDGWRWRSSLSRSDTGNGSCELLWLEAIERRPG